MLRSPLQPAPTACRPRVGSRGPASGWLPVLLMPVLLLPVLLLALLLASAGTLQAAERVHLANGFTMRCDHHALVDGQLRLYSDPAGSNFLELSPASVVRFDTLPPGNPAATLTSGSAVIPQPAAAHASAARQQTIPSPAPLDRSILQPILRSAGQQHDLDVDLLASIVQAESAAHPRAVSRAGAQGLMQLMPATAHTLGVSDSFAPDQNVHGGAAYLDWLLNRYHQNLALALAAYNAGPGAVDRYHGMPPYPETRRYVARVIHLFNQRVRQRRQLALASLAAPEQAPDHAPEQVPDPEPDHARR